MPSAYINIITRAYPHSITLTLEVWDSISELHDTWRQPSPMLDWLVENGHANRVTFRLVTESDLRDMYDFGGSEYYIRFKHDYDAAAFKMMWL